MKGEAMYKKKDKKVMVIAAVVVVIFIAVIYIVPNFSAIFGGGEVVETEPTEYEVLIHKTDAGRIDVKKSYLKQDGESETKLSVAPGTLVSLTVTPKSNKILEEVQIVDAKDFNNQFNTIINETKENTYTVDFSMPETDVVMTFRFETKETEVTEIPEKQEPETKEEETETETKEEGNPYGLTVHGITADLITSFNGQFDDRDFCQQLGDTLHLDSPRSEYYGITDVTFSRDPYTGERDSDKVYYYIYFGEDPDWKMLSTYYLKDQSYVFTKYVEPEPQDEEEEDDDDSVSTSDQTWGSSSSYGSTQGSAGTTYTVPSTGSSTQVSFDILRVSKVFLDYTGDQEAFYSQAFDYVISKGLTGSITGTMSSYEINTDQKTATIEIRLSNGSSFQGTYSKEKNSFRITR